MCQHCEADMDVIATRTAIPRSIVAEVYAAQKALLVEAEENPRPDAELAAEGLDAMRESQGLDLLSTILGPYPHIVITLTPAPGRLDGAMALGMAARGLTRERTLEVMEAAILSARHTETGGVTDSGVIVSPGASREDL